VPKIPENIAWDSAKLNVQSWGDKLLKPVTRIAVDLIAFARILYFDGDVGHVEYLPIRLLTWSMILGIAANSIGDNLATAA